MILGALFIIFFAFLNFALSKYFKDNKASAGVVAFVVSFLLVWGINRTGLDYESFFYTIGFSEDVLYAVLPIVIIIGLVILAVKIGFGWALVIFGAMLIVASFTDLIYEGGITIFLGAIIAGIGLWLALKKPKGKGS
jgi:hypothetical protein